mgnify:CR=1 FL=1
MQMEIAVGMMRWVVDQHQMRGVIAGLERRHMRGQMPEIVVAVDVAVAEGPRVIDPLPVELATELYVVPLDAS